MRAPIAPMHRLHQLSKIWCGNQFGRTNGCCTANMVRITTWGVLLSNFHTSRQVQHEPLIPPKPGEGLTCHFITKEREKKTFTVAPGGNLLDIAQEFDLEMEGACGGSCACSTCHVIVAPEYYEKLPEPSEDEEDMLDLAFGLTETSRLGCQILMSKDIDGITVQLPRATRNLTKEDFK